MKPSEVKILKIIPIPYFLLLYPFYLSSSPFSLHLRDNGGFEMGGGTSQGSPLTERSCLKFLL